MSVCRRMFLIAFSGLLLAGESFAADPSASMLANSFAGWHLSEPAQTSNNPSSADPLNAAVLKEYGFTDVETATYTRDDGHQLTLRAARFEDASGAFGAYTFYRTPEMQPEEIGDQAASLGQRVLFCRGKGLVDATFTKLSAMSAAELRELSDDLPKASGTQSKLPDLIAYLPRQAFVAHSAKYMVGPLALEKIAPDF